MKVCEVMEKIIYTSSAEFCKRFGVLLQKEVFKVAHEQTSITGPHFGSHDNPAHLGKGLAIEEEGFKGQVCLS